MTTPDQVLLSRSVDPGDVTFQRDGLVRALMVPWMTPAEVSDIQGDRVISYREQFARGAFERAERTPHRVQLVWTHDATFANLLGRGVEVMNDPAGEVGLFRLLPSVADKAREALEDSPVSIRFRPIRPQPGSEREGALVTRTEAHLAHLAAVDTPAYVDARVMAIREADEEATARAVRQRESDALMVRTLLLLQDRGHDLTPAQLAWLEAHPLAGPLPAS